VKELTLTVVSMVGPRSRPREVRLWCDPARGTHPRRIEACRVLEQAQGDPARIRPYPGLCNRQYDPVRATAIGVWGRRPIRYSRTFTNPCMMRSETGPVFAF
jgi:hypothetical protein